MSLDGFIEGPNGEFDWCFVDQDYGMTNFLKHVDAIFFGRKSYELALKMGPNPYPNMTKYVFSRRLNSVDGATLIKNKVGEKVKEIKRQKGMDMWLFGGAELANSLLNLGLVDELHLSIHPILLGGGKPLFKHADKRVKLKLIDTKTYSTGLVQLSYEIIHK